MGHDHQQSDWDHRYRIRRNKFPRLVAEGDSWFAYPVWSNMVDFVDSVGRRFAIARAGESGRWLQEIVEDEHYLRLVRSEHPLLLLISGSGNDFVNEPFVTGTDGGKPIFNEYEPGAEAGDLINEAKWHSKLNQLLDCFETIIARVDGAAPIITHGYDYIVPSKEGARYDGIMIAGPWIQPTMHDMGIDKPELQVAIGKLMIDALNDMMGGLEATHPGRFVHVDLRDRLAPRDWANEIHPYEKGFEKVARVYLAEIQRVLREDPGPVLIAGAGGGP